MKPADWPLTVIPVLDLKGGVVVRGVGGRREEYRPIVSRLAADPQPATVAAAFARLGLTTVYVADLDAIADSPPAVDVYRQIAAAGVQLWVDAGVAEVDRACQLGEWRHDGTPLAGIIVALETLPNWGRLEELLAAIGPERLIFSLDLQAGRPMSPSPKIAAQPPLDIAAAAIARGVQRMIVLDLAQVGGERGVSTGPLCQAIHQSAPHLHLTTGGGIRHPHDLATLAAQGVHAALVASALHDGRLLGRDTTNAKQ